MFRFIFQKSIDFVTRMMNHVKCWFNGQRPIETEIVPLDPRNSILE